MNKRHFLKSVPIAALLFSYGLARRGHGRAERAAGLDRPQGQAGAARRSEAGAGPAAARASW